MFWGNLIYVERMMAQELIASHTDKALEFHPKVEFEAGMLFSQDV